MLHGLASDYDHFPVLSSFTHFFVSLSVLRTATVFRGVHSIQLLLLGDLSTSYHIESPYQSAFVSLLDTTRARTHARDASHSIVIPKHNKMHSKTVTIEMMMIHKNQSHLCLKEVTLVHR